MSVVRNGPAVRRLPRRGVGCVPVRDDVALFAKLTLDTFQSGLSWLVVLRKRESILAAMDQLDPSRLAEMEREADRSCAWRRADHPQPVPRSRPTVNNARCFLDHWQSRAGILLWNLLWGHVGGKTLVNAWKSGMRGHRRPVPSESEAMAKELKALGFKWTGPISLLRLHAGSWHGQRPSRRGLLQASSPAAGDPGSCPRGASRLRLPACLARLHLPEAKQCSLVEQPANQGNTMRTAVVLQANGDRQGRVSRCNSSR